MSDIEGKVPRVGTSKTGGERVSMERLGRPTCRRVGITTWEECLTVERAGANEIQSKIKPLTSKANDGTREHTFMLLRFRAACS